MIKVLLAPMLLVAVSLQAQVKQGKVVYERKINMHKRLPPEAEQFKAMVPEFQISKMELAFNATQSLFKNIQEPQDQMPTGTDGGMRRSFTFNMGGGANDQTFRDYDKELIVESRELGPKTYLIDDTLRPLKWKMEEDTMTIAGYLCQKATSMVSGFGMAMGGMRFGGGGGQGRGGVSADSMARRMGIPEQQKVEAWFTTDIESSAGPDSYFGLPGLILKVVVDDGTVEIKALSVENTPKDLVKVPNNGKKITRDEYRKMMAQQFQGMGGRPGGGGMRVMMGAPAN